MATVKVMLNKDKKIRGMELPVVIRVIHNRQKKLIYTPFRVREEDFSAEAELVFCLGDGSGLSAKEAREINKSITRMRKEIEMTLSEYAGAKTAYTAEEVVAEFRKGRNNRYVGVYMQNQINSLNRAGKHGTASAYTSSLNSLKLFTGSRRLTFSEINYHFLRKYMEDMHERGLSPNSINTYVRNLRAVYNNAEKEGVRVTPNYPFRSVKLKNIRTIKRALPLEDIRKIAGYDFSSDKKADCMRDVFMFSFYARGMSCVDMLYLKKENIIGDMIYYSRNKTKQPLQIAITPPLRRLIEKYNRSDSPYVLPFLDDKSEVSLYRQYRLQLQDINRNLKKIGKMLELSRLLTTYVARHSWATIAKKAGFSLAAISEGLGHSSVMTTEIYTQAFDTEVIDDVNRKMNALVQMRDI